MAEMEDYSPNWEGPTIGPGKYIFAVDVKKCGFMDTTKEKPFMKLEVEVNDGPYKGIAFDFRVYIHKKSQTWCVFFLSKFGYPEELFRNTEAPKLRKSQIEGLSGKVLVEVEEDNSGFLRFNVKKFDHADGHEIEDWMEKEAKKGEQADLPARSDSEPAATIDVNQDVQGQPGPQAAAEDFSALD